MNPTPFETQANAEMLSPAWSKTAAAFTAHWGVSDTRSVCKRLRELAGDDDRANGSEFLIPALRTMQALVLQGFHLRGSEKLEGKAPWLRAEAAALAQDAAREWLLTDNLFAFWGRDWKRKSGAPAVTVLDTERVTRFQNGFGAEKLCISVPVVVDGMPERWKTAAQTSGDVELLEAQGEFWRSLVRRKRGKGVARPRLSACLPLLGCMELLSLADSGGAWEHRNLTRQWKVGHSINYGDRAGRTDHFLKPAHVKAIKKAVKDKAGPMDIYTNFDWELVYNFLPAEFFSKAKYEGAMLRLRNWLGPVGLLFGEKVEESSVPLVRAWVEDERALLGGLIEEVLNAPEYWGGAKQKQRIEVGWSNTTMLDAHTLIELVRFATSQGLIGAQTGRELLGFDHAKERARLEAEAGQAGNRPNFEQKQGMVAPGSGPAGGRPPE